MRKQKKKKENKPQKKLLKIIEIKENATQNCTFRFLYYQTREKDRERKKPKKNPKNNRNSFQLKVINSQVHNKHSECVFIVHFYFSVLFLK